ncbi:hypothetical protein CALCODRAFT_483388 [Calocera cornea HHB12733]|uniref:Uncharacterized protein n=1 Tax=Calocera cornea HHB12733 TaxID=1353952 RepID=A0A165FTA1_9BASI|nr:hypothetical protein CALCODRAFT_483388 [Calocera cornea HHB12733]
MESSRRRLTAAQAARRMFAPLLAVLRLPLIAIPELLLLLLDLLLPRSLSTRLIPREDHYAPHPKAGFEGWYMRVKLRGGGDVVCIVCTVRGAEGRGNYVHWSYQPGTVTGEEAGGGKAQGGGEQLPKQVYNLFPASIEESLLPPDASSPHKLFTLLAPGLCEFTRSTAGVSVYLNLPGGLYVKLTVEDMRPVRGGEGRELDGPEGAWAKLAEGLPLHWHVLTLGGLANVEVWRTKAGEEDGEGMDGMEQGVGGEGRKAKVGLLLRGEGIAHCEKNWGLGFPRGWVWSQAFSSSSDPSVPGASFALAGGKILAQRAYMVLFRSPATGREWDFRPPWTVLLFGRGVTIREELDRQGDGLVLDVCDWRRRVVVRVKAQEPRDTWLPMHCPLRNGHRVFASETFTATATVDAFERRGAWVCAWLWGGGGWQWVESQNFDQVAFELGGDYAGYR